MIGWTRRNREDEEEERRRRNAPPKHAPDEVSVSVSLSWALILLAGMFALLGFVSEGWMRVVLGAAAGLCVLGVVWTHGRPGE